MPDRPQHGNYPVFEGYGRTDATQRIANTCSGGTSRDNYRARPRRELPHCGTSRSSTGCNGRVTRRSRWRQHQTNRSASAHALDLFDEFGAPLPLHLRYDTSIHPDRLHEMRDARETEGAAVAGALFGKIDLKGARRRVLFDVHCRHCHGPHLDAYVDPKFIDRPRVSASPASRCLRDDGTCAASSPENPQAGKPLTEAQCLNLQNPQRIADVDARRCTSWRRTACGSRARAARTRWKSARRAAADHGRRHRPQRRAEFCQPPLRRQRLG